MDTDFIKFITSLLMYILCHESGTITSAFELLPIICNLQDCIHLVNGGGEGMERLWHSCLQPRASLPAAPHLSSPEDHVEKGDDRLPCRVEEGDEEQKAAQH